LNAVFNAAIIFAAIAAAAFGILKGDRGERAAAIMLLGSILYVKATSTLFAPPLLDYLFYGGDVALTLTLAFIAWRSPRSWPVWATAFQAIALTVDVAHATDLNLSWVAYAAASNLSAYGVDGALAVGTWIAWREREALSDFGIDARLI
jgi:hypothetical protein